jgi:phosphomevalonate kinase
MPCRGAPLSVNLLVHAFGPPARAVFRSVFSGGVVMGGANQLPRVALHYRVPGKLMLAGEYAVLEGAPAVMIAVDRYVKSVWTPDFSRSGLLVTTRSGAGTAESVQILLPFGRHAAKPKHALIVACVAALESDIELIHEAPTLIGAGRGDRLDVDSSQLSEDLGPEGSTKLGLGSSAAAAVAILIGLVGNAVDAKRLFTLADRAHRLFQRGVGSGADVAASVYGGVIEFQREPDRMEAPPRVAALGGPGRTGCIGIAVWTGQSASTTNLVGSVQELRKTSSSCYRACMEALGLAAESAIEALRSGNAASLIAAVEAGSSALGRLGKEASVELVLPVHEQLRTLAQRYGGAAKPTGAGGGDIALAVLPRNADVETFLAELERDGMRHVALGVSERGAHPVLSADDTPRQAFLRL